MSAPTSRGEALRKEGIFVPASKGANPQKSRKTRDKSSGETTSSTQPAPLGQKDTNMPGQSIDKQPAVIGTDNNPAGTDPFETLLALAATAPEKKVVFSGQRIGALAVDTLVVVAVTAAAVGAGYGVYHLVTKP